MISAEWSGFVFGIMAIPFPPVLDGDFFTESPGRYLARGNFKRTDILLGTNREEGFFFILYYLSDTIQKQVSVGISTAIVLYILRRKHKDETLYDLYATGEAQLDPRSV